MDVRQRDLYIKSLADRMAALEDARRQQAIDNQALEDEVLRWRLKYDSDMRESNETTKKLRRMIEDRDDEIRLLRAKRETDLGSFADHAGASRVGFMADRIKELTLRNRELEEMMNKMSKDMVDGNLKEQAKGESTLRSTAVDIHGSLGRPTASIGDQQVEINSLRVGLAQKEGTQRHTTEQGVFAI